MYAFQPCQQNGFTSKVLLIVTKDNIKGLLSFPHFQSGTNKKYPQIHMEIDLAHLYMWHVYKLYSKHHWTGGHQHRGTCMRQ